jgi:hypothetical protein
MTQSPLNSITEQEIAQGIMMRPTLVNALEAKLDCAKLIIIDWMTSFEKRFDSDENQPLDDMLNYMYSFDIINLVQPERLSDWQRRVYDSCYSVTKHPSLLIDFDKSPNTPTFI